jgi:CheY-like chemotaxis protein
VPNDPILVVDDDRAMRWLLQKQIEKLNYAVETACNGQEAVGKLAVRRYRLIMMDVRMPIMDGLEAARYIRSVESMTGRPRATLIAVTGTTDEESCLAAGFDDFRSLPLSTEDMKELLERWSILG